MGKNQPDCDVTELARLEKEVKISWEFLRTNLAAWFGLWLRERMISEMRSHFTPLSNILAKLQRSPELAPTAGHPFHQSWSRTAQLVYRPGWSDCSAGQVEAGCEGWIWRQGVQTLVSQSECLTPWSTFSCGRLFLHSLKRHWTQSFLRMLLSEILRQAPAILTHAPRPRNLCHLGRGTAAIQGPCRGLWQRTCPTQCTPHWAPCWFSCWSWW